MALLLKKMYQGYFWIFEEIADQRTNNFPILSHVLTPLIIIALYNQFVFKWGPSLMKNRKPLELKYVLIFYNALQVMLNSYLVVIGTKEIVTRLNWSCALVDYSESPLALYHLDNVLIYYILKLLDLLDTLFIVLRKRDRQITFLHVYHHSGMVWLAWVGYRFLGGGHSIYMGVLNSFVHSIMYAYYLLSLLDGKYKKVLWIKKHITQMQLIQFSLFIFIYGRLLFIDCDYPKIVSYFFVPQNMFMLCLFGEFYYRTYIKKNNKVK